MINLFTLIRRIPIPSLNRIAKSKILLILLGFSLSIVTVELILQATSYIYTITHDDPSNLLPKNNRYRVLTIGESGTASDFDAPAPNKNLPRYLQKKHPTLPRKNDSSYPAVLSRYLHHHYPEKFQVINGGIPNSDSAFLLHKRRSFLKKYNPDIVIFMMGINDDQNTIEYTNTLSSEISIRLSSLKTAKLFNLLKKRFYEKFEKIPDTFKPLPKSYFNETFDDEKEFNKFLFAMKKHPVKSELPYAAIQNIFDSEVSASIKITEESFTSLLLFNFFKEHKQTKYAIQALYSIFAANPFFHFDLESARQMATTDSKAYEIISKIQKAELVLTREKDVLTVAFLYLLNNDLLHAYNVLQTYYDYHRTHDVTYMMAITSLLARRLDSAANLIKEAHTLRTKKRPNATKPFQLLAQYYSNDFKVIANILNISYSAGRHVLISYLANKKNRIPPDAPVYETLVQFVIHDDIDLARRYKTRYMLSLKNLLHNYLKFIDLALAANAQVIIMQYPTLSLQPLEEFLQEHQDRIHFVSHEDEFNNILDKGDYKTLFYDRNIQFMGHCTWTGNWHVTKKLVRTILSITSKPTK